MAEPADLRFPSIDGLRAFDAAARLGTFERAADELHVTASAVSKRVATVEDLIGAPLLLRQGKQLALTATGREYLEQVRTALGLLAAMPQHRRAAQRVRRLRVTCPPTFARQVLVPHLASFTDAHPEVELEVVLSIPFLDLHPGDADVEVRSSDTPQATPLMDDIVLPMAAPALLARLPPLHQPADLVHAPLLRTPIEPWAPWFQAAGLAWPEPASGHKLVDLGLTLEAAASGQGVALGRPSLAQAWLLTGALVPLFPVHIPARQRYHLGSHAASGTPADFAAWLGRTCRRIAAEAAATVQAQLSGRA